MIAEAEGEVIEGVDSANLTLEMHAINDRKAIQR